MAEWTVGIVRFDHRDEDDDGVDVNVNAYVNFNAHKKDDDFKIFLVKLPTHSAALQANFWTQ